MQSRESCPLLFHLTSQCTRGHLGMCKVGSHTVTWAWRSGWNLSSPRDHTHGGNRAHSQERCTGIQAGLPGRQEMKPWAFEVSLWNLPCLLLRLMGSRPFLAQTLSFSRLQPSSSLYIWGLVRASLVFWRKSLQSELSRSWSWNLPWERGSLT